MIKEIEEIIGIEAEDAVRVSAKTGENVTELLEELVRRVPPPHGDPEAPLQALIIDSWFDNYVGVVSLVRVMNGTLKTGEKIRVLVHRPRAPGRQARSLHAQVAGRGRAATAGEVGFVIAGIKEIDGAPVGDTITIDSRPMRRAAAGLQGDQAAGVRGPVPGQLRRLRGVPRRACRS